MDRRTFLPVSLAGALAAAAVPRKLFAAEMSDAERANVKLITDMIAAFDAAAATVPPAADSLRPFFTDDCAFRFRPTDQTATRDFGAVEQTMKRVTVNGQKVQQELLDRFAKGPVVAIEKLNHFVTPEKTRTSHVVAICLVKDGKIAEWTEYFISVAVQ
jgi:ketosteroid isomerase-like protein